MPSLVVQDATRGKTMIVRPHPLGRVLIGHALRPLQHAALAEKVKLSPEKDCAAQAFLELLIFLRCVSSHIPRNHCLFLSTPVSSAR